MSDPRDEHTESVADEGDDGDPPGHEDVADAIEDLLVPDPPHSPASDADAPPPG